MWTVAVRAARPAIVAAAVLATARALGEAIMLSMVSGSVGFAPNPLDGLTFFFEPTRPLAATIVDNAEGLSVEPFGQTIYAFAAVLLVSQLFLSLRRLGRPSSRMTQVRRSARSAMSRARHSAARAPAAPPAPPAAQAPRRARPGAAATASASRCAGRPASLLCADRRRDRRSTCWSAGSSTCSLDAARRPTRRPGLDQSEDRRLPRPDDRHLLLTVLGTRSPRRSASRPRSG